MVMGSNLAIFNLFLDGDVCIRWHCTGTETYGSYCFPKGDIIGSVMVWVDQKILVERPQNVSGIWPLYHPRHHRRNMTHL